MERAIDNAVAIELDMCDLKGRPVYKVRTSTTHSFSTSRVCEPIVNDNTCIVVNGETAVLLDKYSDAIFVKNRVYLAIEHGLSDEAFLNGFTNSVVSAALVSEGHASLVENSSHYHERADGNKSSYRTGVTTTVAVAAASVTILVASIFCYGFVRRPNSHDPSVRHRTRNLSLRKPSPRTIVSGSQLDDRRHFVRLEDFPTSPTSFVTASISPHSYPDGYSRDVVEEYPPEYSDEEYYHEDNYNSGINWSVSDITSDSASLRSGVSRTPSMLERIDEEIENEEEDIVSEVGDGDSCNFSYSEDSTIITKALSKASLLDQEHHDEVKDDHCHARAYVSEFDCTNEQQDQVLDISVLDPCFTILPDNPEDLFRDQEDLSSESTEESLLESIILEMRLSTEAIDRDSFETASSDTSLESLISLLSSEDLPELNQTEEASPKTLIVHTDDEIRDDDTLESFSSDSRSIELQNNFVSRSEIEEENKSLDPTIDEIAARVKDLIMPTEAEKEALPAASDSKADGDETISTTATQNEYAVNDPDEVISSTKVQGETEANETPSCDISHVCGEEKHKLHSFNGNKSSDVDTNEKKNTVDIENNASIELYPIEGYEKAGVDDDLGANLQAVDSIDQWVSELMNHNLNGEPESTISEL